MSNTDLIARLRNYALPDPLHAPMLREAADEIERLEAQVQSLKQTIEILKHANS